MNPRLTSNPPRHEAEPLTEGRDPRPMPVRARPDLTFSRLFEGTRASWVAKEPVSMSYVQLGEQEYEVLRSLDGKTSLKAIKAKLERRFYPARVTNDAIERLVARLNSENLVIVDSYGQDHAVHRRRLDQNRRQRFATIGSLLAYRFPGVNPNRFLDAIDPVCRFAFTQAAFWIGVMICITATLCVVANWTRLQEELPTAQTVTAPSTLFFLALSLLVAKTLHELAHALTCKHFGGDCYEVGVILLAFTPCLYCNVSDSWMFPSRWQRIAVSAAGIAVEVLLAAICSIIWCFSEAGFVHSICLHLALVCCVSTLVVNGNPLLRFDGYYILADIVETPNLWQQASQVIGQLTGQLIWGERIYSRRVLPRSGWFWLVAYWVASMAFRTTVVFGVLWTVLQVTESHHLGSLGRVFVFIVVSGVLLAGVSQVIRVQRMISDRRRRSWRAPVSVAVATGILAGAALFPVNHTVNATAVLWPCDAHRLYVYEPGTLQSSLRYGDVVKQGETVACLSDLELEQEILRLQSQCELQRRRVENLVARRAQDVALGSDLPTAREMLTDLEHQLAERRFALDRLTIKSPIAGTVLPPASVPRDFDAGTLSHWDGRAFEPRNLGAPLETGTLLGHVGNLSNIEAQVFVDDAADSRLREGLTTWIEFESGERLRGRIVEISIADAEVPSRRDEFTRDAVEARSYARVILDNPDQPWLCGRTARAETIVGTESLMRRGLNYLNRTFRSQL